MAGDEVVSVGTVLVALVLNGKLGKVAEDVLHVGIRGGTLGTTKVVQPSNLVEEVVDDSDDDGDSDRVTPDDDDSDNGGVAVVGKEHVLRWWVRWLTKVTAQPSEDTEEGGEDIDTKDGTDELPRWPGVGTTGNEDKPILSEGNLKEEYTLNGSEVVNDTSVWKEESTTENPGTKSKEYTKNDGNNPDLWQLPLDRALLVVSVVVGNGDGSQISEQGQEDDQIDSDSLLDDNH